VSTGTQTGEVDLCLRACVRAAGGPLATAADALATVVAWDRDKAARRRNARVRERVDLVFWAGEPPGELVIQAASAFGREMAADDERIRQQLEGE
jgi:hypothetical protein